MPRTSVAPYRANTGGRLSANMLVYYRANGDTVYLFVYIRLCDTTPLSDLPVGFLFG